MKAGSKLSELCKIQRTGDRIVLPLVQEHLLSQWGRGDRDPGVVHVSEMAKKDWCERATYYRIKTGQWPEEKYSFNMQSIFDEGHQIHDKWQQWLAVTGRLWGNWQCQVCTAWVSQATRNEIDRHAGPCGRRLGHLWQYKEVELAFGLIHGHEDGAVDDRLIEFKSVGLGTLRKDSPGLLAKYYKTTTEGGKLYDLEALWKGLKQPLMSHVRQANMYLYLAGRMGLPFSKASIVYEYKPNQQAREYVIPMSVEIVEPLIERVEYIEVALAQDYPPLCPYKGCRQCQAYDDKDQADSSADANHVRTPSGRVLTHTRADQRDRPAAGAVRGRGQRIRGGRRAEPGEAGHEPRQDI